MPRYIDADALIHHFYETEYASMYYVEVVKRIIDAQPTISPDEVRSVGEWIRIPGFHLDHEYYPARYQCDQCKHFVDSGDGRNYCPNCGAKMKGAEGNNTMDEFMYGQEMGSHSDGSL